MENASKALIMAGGVLIAIMVLTIGVFLIGKLGSTADSYVTTLDATELQKYNSSFEVFTGRENITAQELVTIISLAQQKEKETTIVIKGEVSDVKLDYTKCMEWDEPQKSEFLKRKIEEAKSNNGNMTLYSCTADSIQYDNAGKVKIIKFEKK